MKNLVYETPVQSEMDLVARVAVTAGYLSGSKNVISFAGSLFRGGARYALQLEAVTSNNYCKLNNVLMCAMLSFLLLASSSFNSL